MFFKKNVKRLLSHPAFVREFSKPFLGRLSRKVVHIVWAVVKFLAAWFSQALVGIDKVYKSLPYVQLTSRRFGNNGLDITSYIKYLGLLRTYLDRMTIRPKISVLIPVYKVKPEYLREALDSVVTQVWTDWEICLVDDASNDPALLEIYQEYERKLPDKFKWSVHDVNQHISHSSNSCLQLASGQYIALLDHDDRLTPNALAEMVRYVNLNNGPDILFSDERVVDQYGNCLSDPFFKPTFSPNLHLAVNYTTHLTLYNTEMVRSIGGFRPGFEGSQDHDLMLRMCETSKKQVVHVPFLLYQWRAHPGSTARNIDSKPYAAIAGEKAVYEAIHRRGRPGTVAWEPDLGHYRVRYDLPKHSPIVSIIIPSKDAYKTVKTCIDSVFSKSTWQNFEVILVDNGSTDPNVLTYFESLSIKEPLRFVHLKDSSPFNFASLNNQGVKAAKGEFVVLLNNDTEVVAPEWIEELMSLAQWPEVGAVGAKLLFPDGSLQHAGVVTLGQGIAGHTLIGQNCNTHSYIAMAQTIHEASIVTAACFMIEKKKYLSIGGLDEVWVPNGYGDVEFCLRLRRNGFSNIYTPYAVLTHFESKSRKQTLEYFEHFYLRNEYGRELLWDPYLNPNLHLAGEYQPNDWYLGMDVDDFQFKEICQSYIRDNQKT